MKNVSDATEHYLRHCQFEKNLGTLTLKAYKQDLDQFLKEVGPQEQLSKLDKQTIRDYIRHLFSKNLKPTSIRRKVASIKAFLRFLEHEDIIPVSPFRKLEVNIKIPKRLPNYLSLQEVRQLLFTSRDLIPKAPHGDPNKNNGLYKSLQCNVIIELLFSSGVRVSELCGLNMCDVDISKRAIRVAGKGLRERTVIITTSEFQSVLESFLCIRSKVTSEDSALLINRVGKRMQPYSVRHILKLICRKANLPKVTPHIFRHTIATLLLENGIDSRFVQKFLGHSSILTTQIYTHLSTSAERAIVGDKHPRNFI